MIGRIGLLLIAGSWSHFKNCLRRIGVPARRCTPAKGSGYDCQHPPRYSRTAARREISSRSNIACCPLWHGNTCRSLRNRQGGVRVPVSAQAIRIRAHLPRRALRLFGDAGSATGDSMRRAVESVVEPGRAAARQTRRTEAQTGGRETQTVVAAASNGGLAQPLLSYVDSSFVCGCLLDTTLSVRALGIRGPGEVAAFVLGSAFMLGWASGVDLAVNFHNHAHVPLFRSDFLNRWLTRFWAVTSGWPGFVFAYAHLEVHHRFLVTGRDWTLPKRRAERN